MQFQVPQFETENKLVGPFTVIQFVYVGVAAALSFLLFPILTTWFWFVISSFLMGTSLVIALMKVNGRPMPIFMLAAFRYLWEPKVLTLKPKPGEVVGLKHIEPLPPSKKFEVPRQMPAAAGPVSATAGLAMPPVSPPVGGPAKPFEISVAPSMPAPSAPAEPMKISPTTEPVSAAAGPVSATAGLAMPPVSPPVGGPAKPFEISAAPSKAIPITPATSAVPSVPVPPPIATSETPVAAPVPEKKRSRLQNLFNKITTTSSPIPFREESLKQASSSQKGYEFVEKSTGETIVARRVDYR
jgi:hypothetical protein